MTTSPLRRLWVGVLIALGGCGDATDVTTADVTADATTACTQPSLAVGEVLTGLSDLGVCFSNTTSAQEFALISFNSSTSSAASAFSVSFSGTSSSLSSVASLASNSTALDEAESSALKASRNPTIERRIRASERAVLPRLMTSARSWRTARLASQSSSGARFSVSSTAAIGQVVSLNANADDACTNARYRGGRIAAISTRAIVVADTANPSGGFSDAEYASFATTFDTLIDPVDRDNFGDPTDIDENGRVVLFFTSAVNALTPAKSSSYVAGFFYARDLFPASGTSADVCAGSNVGEMFYLLAPDPSGTVNGNIFTKADVLSGTLGTLAHEYQHLINASRRVYVNNATDWEETWLDEGLSHVAEELLFYKAAGLTPGANLTATTLRSSQTYLDAVNAYQIENLGRYSDYLARPSSSSPYADDDSLWTRGATWSFLRYLADHQSASQATIWHQLANSTTTGMENLQAVFGTDIATKARDWAVSGFTDDLVTTATAYAQPSWNYRSIFPAMGIATFPLATSTGVAGSPSAVSVVGGGMAVLRFGVGAGANATVTWAGKPTAVTLALVRTK